MTVHELLPDKNHDEAALQSFVRDFRRFLRVEVMPGTWQVYERRVRPEFRRAHGKDPAIDKPMAMLLSLIGELSVARERIDALERVLEAKGLMSREEIDSFVADEDAQTERAAMRNAYIARVMHVVAMEHALVDSRGATAEFNAALEDLLESGND